MLTLLNERLISTTLVYLIILAGWGLINALVGKGLTRQFAGALVIGELLLVAIGALQLLQHAFGQTFARPGVHALYSLMIALTLPVAFIATGGRTTRWEALVYALVCVFLWGMLPRVVETSRLAG
jgi:hypothetical protein